MKSSRERLLITILPACVILGLYGWTISRNLHDQLQNSRQRLETAEKGYVSTAQLQGLKSQLRSKGRSIDSLQAGLTEARQHLPSTNYSMKHAETVRELSQVLTAEGLTIISEEIKEESVGRLPSRLRQIADPQPVEPTGRASRRRRSSSTESANANRKVHLWEVVFTGTFPDVERAISRIADEIPAAIPVSLEMEQVDFSSTSRQWKVVVWI